MEKNLIEQILKIEGMTCGSCEARIKRRLLELPGVADAQADYRRSDVRILYDPETIGPEQMKSAIEELGYTVSDPHGDSKLSINHFLGIGIILLAIYLILKNTAGLNFIPQVSPNMSYGILFVVGLLTSLHCIAMCGGINLSQCLSPQYQIDNPGRMSNLKPSLKYNAGRVLSYTIIGGIVGALGSAVSFSGAAKGSVAILAGLLMMIMGLNMLNLFPWLRILQPRIPRVFRNKLPQSGRHGPFFVGLCNGLMPCGPLQTMQLYALGTGSIATGALSMLAFSLGTVPLMFAFGAISTFVSGKFTAKMMKVSAALVIMLGFIMFSRGLSLSGINPAYAGSLFANSAAASSVAKIENNLQVVTTKLEPGKYAPITVQKGIPVKWNMKADAKSINGCNNKMIIPEYGIEKELQPGDNIIEFTPNAEGNIVYTCWMGMISSNIKVVADLNQLDKSGPDPSSSLNSSGIGSGSCCADIPPRFANGRITTDKLQLAEIKDGEQTVTVIVNDQGYTPAAVIMQKGVKGKIIFKPENLNPCNRIVVFPEYRGQLDLSQENQTETPWLEISQDFTFQCGMNMLHGYVKVVDDINQVNLEAVKKEIQSFKPALGGGCH